MPTNDPPTTAEGTPPLYDDSEARIALADLTRNWGFHEEARRRAVRALVEEFGVLAESYGIKVENRTGQLPEWIRAQFAWVFFPRPRDFGMIVIIRSDEVAVISEQDLDMLTPPTTLRLRFNPTDKRFEGEELDPTVSPALGRRRSALAILTAAVLAPRP